MMSKAIGMKYSATLQTFITIPKPEARDVEVKELQLGKELRQPHKQPRLEGGGKARLPEITPTKKGLCFLGVPFKLLDSF